MEYQPHAATIHPRTVLTLPCPCAPLPYANHLQGPKVAVDKKHTSVSGSSPSRNRKISGPTGDQGHRSSCVFLVLVGWQCGYFSSQPLPNFCGLESNHLVVEKSVHHQFRHTCFFPLLHSCVLSLILFSIDFRFFTLGSLGAITTGTFQTRHVLCTGLVRNNRKHLAANKGMTCYLLDVVHQSSSHLSFGKKPSLGLDPFDTIEGCSLWHTCFLPFPSPESWEGVCVFFGEPGFRRPPRTERSLGRPCRLSYWLPLADHFRYPHVLHFASLPEMLHMAAGRLPLLLL